MSEPTVIRSRSYDVRAYPNVALIDDDTYYSPGELKMLLEILAVEQSKIDEARAVLDTEFIATKYQKQRAEEYPPLEDICRCYVLD